MDYNKERAQKMIEEAFETLKALDNEFNLTETYPPDSAGVSFEDEGFYFTGLAHLDEKDISRTLTADYNPESGKLDIGYEVWKDFEIPNDKNLRLEIGKSIHTEETYEEVENIEKISAALKSAYEESMNVSENKLKEEGIGSRVN